MLGAELIDGNSKHSCRLGRDITVLLRGLSEPRMGEKFPQNIQIFQKFQSERHFPEAIDTAELSTGTSQSVGVRIKTFSFISRDYLTINSKIYINLLTIWLGLPIILCDGRYHKHRSAVCRSYTRTVLSRVVHWFTMYCQKINDLEFHVPFNFIVPLG